MKVKNTTLVITDPCYIKKSIEKTCYLNKSTIYGDWSCMCYKGKKEDVKEKTKEWDKIYFDFFNTYNFSGKTQEEKEELYKNFKETKDKWISDNCFGEFCADSGQVAVYDYDTLSDEDQNWIKEHNWCACIVPNYSGEFNYEIEYEGREGEEGTAHIVGETFYTTQSGF